MKSKNRKSLRNLLESILDTVVKIMPGSFMEILFNAQDKAEHDAVARASAASYTYDILTKHNLVLDTNIDLKHRFIGDISNPLYPDIILWRPDYPTSPRGKAIIIEKIDTKRSIEKNWLGWVRYANYGVIFTLIVPASEITNVKYKLGILGIANKTRLQSYTYDFVTKQYRFTNVT